MNPRFLELYNQELQFLRDLGTEFARSNPRIAARLDLASLPSSDPYVERLLEGVAFLTARVQLKLEARHPEFCQHLLELVYPQFLAPLPACGIVEFQPDLKEGSLQQGVRIARGSTLKTVLGKGDRTACEFRTAQDVTLWPIEMTEVRYVSGAGALAGLGVGADSGAKAAIALRVKAAAGLAIRSMPLNALTFHLRAEPAQAAALYEQITAQLVGFELRTAGQGILGARHPAAHVTEPALEDAAALLPDPARGLSGYRLLQEYFLLPERFLFFRLEQLAVDWSRVEGETTEIYLLLDRIQPVLENSLDATQFRLNCAAIVNLFPRRLDRLTLSPYETENHLVPDRNRPLDFEVHTIERVQGIGTGGERLADIRPIYATELADRDSETPLSYTLQRRRRLLPARPGQAVARSAYLGTECFLSITAAGNKTGVPIRQVDVQALCTNRDLPLMRPFGRAATDFVLEGAAPVMSIRCLGDMASPRDAPAFGEPAWRLIEQLALNIDGLSDPDAERGAARLRQLLSLFASPRDVSATRLVEGVRKTRCSATVRRLPVSGPIVYGRGQSIELELDEAAFSGTSPLLLGAILERYFARLASINAFTELQLSSATRGPLRRWSPRIGARAML